MDEVVDQIHQLASEYRVDGLKLYPVWGADGTGWWLDEEETGLRVLQASQDAGIRTIAIHKGLPQPGMDPTYSRPKDRNTATPRSRTP